MTEHLQTLAQSQKKVDFFGIFYLYWENTI